MPCPKAKVTMETIEPTSKGLATRHRAFRTLEGYVFSDSIAWLIIAVSSLSEKNVASFIVWTSLRTSLRICSSSSVFGILERSTIRLSIRLSKGFGAACWSCLIEPPRFIGDCLTFTDYLTFIDHLTPPLLGLCCYFVLVYL